MKPHHPHCRCVLVRLPPPDPKAEELGRKLAAQVMLRGKHKAIIIIPSADEWYGLNLLARDDGLPRSKRK